MERVLHWAVCLRQCQYRRYWISTIRRQRLLLCCSCIPEVLGEWCGCRGLKAEADVQHKAMGSVSSPCGMASSADLDGANTAEQYVVSARIDDHECV